MDFRATIENHPDSMFRIRFTDGEIFVLRMVRNASEAAGTQDTWTGFIVAREGLSESDMTLHTIGGGLDFKLSDIESLSIVESLTL